MFQNMSNKMIQNDSQNINLNLIESAQLGKTNHIISLKLGLTLKNDELCELT